MPPKYLQRWVMMKESRSSKPFSLIGQKDRKDKGFREGTGTSGRKFPQIVTMQSICLAI
jgi:hypothetical protein